MTDLTRGAGRRLALPTALIVLLGLVAAAPGNAADATHRSARSADSQAQAETEAPSYLALGDSVSFGYRESANQPTPDYSDASSFVGFPELVGSALHLKVVNASCPGETSASLVKMTNPSNGCESSPGGGPGYRTAFPLHQQYVKSQLVFGVRYLLAHPDTKLVTLMIGANDGFLCQQQSSDGCVSEGNRLVTRIRNYVDRTLSRIRHRAHYHGQIVVVTYYSTDYRDSMQTFSSRVVNGAVTSAAAPYHVQVADGFGAFQDAAAQSQGDTCGAGLLTFLTTGGCGVHPSVAGQNVLAHAVEAQVWR